MKLWLTNRSDKSAYVNIFSEHSCILHALITSPHIDFYNSLTVHVFHLYKQLFLYYETETIVLMTREAVSFEKVFH